MENLNKEKAIEIINEVRSSNPFTACQTLEEYVKGFVKRYRVLFEEELKISYEEIAKIIIEYGIK